MANVSRLILIALLLLLLAGVVYAAGDVLLQPGEAVDVRCAGQHYAVARSIGGTVRVTCKPNPVYPQVAPLLYLPVVLGG